MQRLLSRLKDIAMPERLPPAAQHEQRLDHGYGRNPSDGGCWPVIYACTDWLCQAQDHSASADGGVARDYSLVKGWATSYPETTGYIIPTVIELAQRLGRDDLHQRARRMLDWCVEIQFPEGGFQGGRIDSTPCVPVTFNTGQILLGLAAGAAAYGEDRYHRSMLAAARWLRDSLDADGCWRRFPTPFAEPGEKAYETHVAWGLFEAERVAPGQGFAEAGLRQVAWALGKQQPNGWFAANCLSNPLQPLTHTIGYVLRGVLEAHRLTGHAHLLEAALRTADSLYPLVGADGRLPGRWDDQWRPAVDWVCLTGSVQIAHCLLMLHQATGSQDDLAAALRLNAYVRRTVRLEGPPEVRGGVKGSFPVDGRYGRFEYLNWAAKFCIDANLLEADITGQAHA